MEAQQDNMDIDMDFATKEGTISAYIARDQQYGLLPEGVKNHIKNKLFKVFVPADRARRLALYRIKQQLTNATGEVGTYSELYRYLESFDNQLVEVQNRRNHIDGLDTLEEIYTSLSFEELVVLGY